MTERRTPLEANSGTDKARLTVVVLHEGFQTEQWASRLCNRVLELLGSDALRVLFWSAIQLRNTAALSAAISAATGADVIVVAVRVAGPLAPEFREWIDGWASKRRRSEGALIGLIGVGCPPRPSVDEVEELLRVAARSAGLDFLLREQAVGNSSTA